MFGQQRGVRRIIWRTPTNCSAARRTRTDTSPTPTLTGDSSSARSRYLDRHNIHDCSFGYFVQPSIDYHSYGIPCRQLPTANSMWTEQQVDVPATISGTILVSAGTLTGYEFGSVILSPFSPS